MKSVNCKVTHNKSLCSHVRIQYLPLRYSWLTEITCQCWQSAPFESSWTWRFLLPDDSGNSTWCMAPAGRSAQPLVRAFRAFLSKANCLSFCLQCSPCNPIYQWLPGNPALKTSAASTPSPRAHLSLQHAPPGSTSTSSQSRAAPCPCMFHCEASVDLPVLFFCPVVRFWVLPRTTQCNITSTSVE